MTTEHDIRYRLAQAKAVLSVNPVSTLTLALYDQDIVFLLDIIDELRELFQIQKTIIACTSPHDEPGLN